MALSISKRRRAEIIKKKRQIFADKWNEKHKWIYLCHFSSLQSARSQWTQATRKVIAAFHRQRERYSADLSLALITQNSLRVRLLMFSLHSCLTRSKRSLTALNKIYIKKAKLQSKRTRSQSRSTKRNRAGSTTHQNGRESKFSYFIGRIFAKVHCRPFALLIFSTSRSANYFSLYFLFAKCECATCARECLIDVFLIQPY